MTEIQIRHPGTDAVVRVEPTRSITNRCMVTVTWGANHRLDMPLADASLVAKAIRDSVQEQLIDEFV